MTTIYGQAITLRTEQFDLEGAGDQGRSLCSSTRRPSSPFLRVHLGLVKAPFGAFLCQHGERPKRSLRRDAGVSRKSREWRESPWSCECCEPVSMSGSRSLTWEPRRFSERQSDAARNGVKPVTGVFEMSIPCRGGAGARAARSSMWDSDAMSQRRWANDAAGPRRIGFDQLKKSQPGAVAEPVKFI